MAGFIQDLTARALRFDEKCALFRAQPELFPQPPIDSSSSILDDWSAYAGGRTNLEQRLAVEQISILDLPRLLAGPIVWHGPIPQWAAFWQREFNPEIPAASNPQIPFSAIFQPLVDAAFLELPDAKERLSPNACEDLRTALLRRLSRLAAPTFCQLFRAWLKQHDARWIFFDVDTADGDANYQLFVHAVAAQGLAVALSAYPVLLRLLAEQFEHWISATTALLKRLDSDYPELCLRFGGELGLGQIIGLDAGMSDAHHGGQSVAAIRFQSGAQVVYKPRNIDIESAWFDLLGTFNLYSDLKHRILKTLPRAEYGWVERAVPADCTDSDAARRYHRRAGSLLAFVYILSGTDCHYQNWIAAGEFPVLVDLETLLHPPAQLWSSLPRHSLSRSVENQLASVLSTGVLPAWSLSETGQRFDASALGARGEISHGSAWRCEFPNTDRMRVELSEAPAKAAQNAVRIEGQPLSLEHYTEELVQGFRDTCAWVHSQRAEWLCEGGPLARLVHCRQRIILRASSNYALLLNHMLARENLRDAMRYELCAESLARSWLSIFDPETRRRGFQIFLAEKAALLKQDIPHFSAEAPGLALMDRHAQIPDFLWVSTPDRIGKRIESLDQDECTLQEQFIRQSLRARYATPAKQSKAHREPPGSADELLAAAISIGKQLQTHAIPLPDGSVTWLSFRQDGILGAAGVDLYEGRVGIALFLAALYRSTGANEWKELALKSINGVAPEKAIGLGIAAGLGGMALGLQCIAGMLDTPLDMDPSHWNDLLKQRDPHQLDAMAGQAGALIGYLTVPQFRQHPKTMERLISLGDALLDGRTVAATGHRTWRIAAAAEPLTGFAHGASGFAFALLGLGRATGNGAFLAAAEESMAYESALRTMHGIWPDLRGGGGTPLAGWCAGAPGIGWTRALATTMDIDSARAEWDAACGLTISASFECNETLCCGRAARILFLIRTYEMTGREDCRKEAWVHATALARRPREHWSPGLFRGISGIGYALLRVVRPDVADLFSQNG